ncbi:hypothetical protein [Saccharothrix obliqua]|uniref:hypothetical protein n=1 Tax=Saccharothrix obliqua TaxID=2861747 RepID=UPI001C5EA065|nr:hypothetical protein [Saccharothrix obliqua]MBW4722174.1 hypothetical protein [Saccharothrix obliqua]
MRIEIRATAHDTVHFRCGQGDGAGVWHSPEPPRVGAAYDVELDVDGDIRLHPGGGSGFRLDGGHVVIGGVLWFTDDGAPHLEVAGSPVALELAGDAPVEPGEPATLTVPLSAVHLYPYSL